MDSLNIYKTQETLRLSDSDLEFLHENYEEIANTDARIPIGRFLMFAVQKACQVVAPKTSKPEDLAMIEQLKEKLIQAQRELNIAGQTATQLSLENDRLKQDLADKVQLIEDFKKDAPAGSILLNLSKDQYTFVWSALQLYKRDRNVQSFEEMFMSIIEAFQGMGYLQFTTEDIEYLKKIAEEIKNGQPV